jgi:hypothetical protein
MSHSFGNELTAVTFDAVMASLLLIDNYLGQLTSNVKFLYTFSYA